MQADIGRVPLRVGLIGVGHWHAPLHAAAVVAAGASLAAAWDADAATASSFARQWHCPAADSVEAVLDAADIVVVMGRPATVPALAEATLAAGKPMILEKPAAVSAAGLAGLLAQARSNDAFVAVPLPNRFGPAMEERGRLAAEGRAGPLAHAHFRLVNGPPGRYVADGVGWMLDPVLSGGGALRNLGIHGVDGALALATGEL